MTALALAYPTSPIKRARRTKSEMEAIRAALYEIVAADQPMTVRQVFYQAVVAGAVEKSEAEYQNSVSRLLVQMRRDGTIPYHWIADSTRWVRRPTTYRTPHAFVEEVLSGIGGRSGLNRGGTARPGARRRRWPASWST